MLVKASTKYTVECFDKDGNLKWEENFDNLVTTQGLNCLLNSSFLTNQADPVITYSPTTSWYIGLKDEAGTIQASDTLASHTWNEISTYTVLVGGVPTAQREAFRGNALSSSGTITNSSSKASFTMTADDNIYGCFLCSVATGGTGSDVLYGVGDFVSYRSVVTNDVLQVTVTLTQTSA